MAMSTFWPRAVGVIDVFSLREHYLSAEEAFTMLALVDTQIELLRSTRASIRTKVVRIKISMMALLFASSITAIGVAVR